MPLGQAQWQLARTLGITGVWMALVLTLAAWVGVFGALVPARAALRQAHTQLLALDKQLADAQETLAPFDLLSRPETLGAVQTLNHLAQSTRDMPIVNSFFGQESLQEAVGLTEEWQTALQDRPPLPALAEARESVQGWQARISQIQRRVTLLAWAFCLVFTLLGAWFALGQVALYRAAERRIGETYMVK